MNKNRRNKIVLVSIAFSALAFYAFLPILSEKILSVYENEESPVIKDRIGFIIKIEPNSRGFYRRETDAIPPELMKLAVKKEDRYFYYHPGINPFSVLRDIISYAVSGKLRGSSTITQQLAKILLGNENNRTMSNKITEAVYALSLETRLTKSEILKMYLNSAYFGNLSQGILEASRYYYNKSPEELNELETIKLLAALNNPSSRYPGTAENQKFVSGLANMLEVSAGSSLVENSKTPTPGLTGRKNNAAFETKFIENGCQKICDLTIDADLTEKIRLVLKRNLDEFGASDSAENGAVVVIKLPENEILAVVGTPDPFSSDEGKQINMAIKPRSAGSTVKPFVYLKAFEKGARPYSLVDDREYAYKIETGYSFYPKNYDGKYRGIVTIHEALSNSLNVPAVKVMEFAGLEEVFSFFNHGLGFNPVQPIENYGLGAVLGNFEIDLLTLAHYFTIFPNDGEFKPLKIYADSPYYAIAPMGSELPEVKKIAEKDYTALINKILSDRETAVDQFGMKSNLTFPQKNYAVKTGTSRDYRDSWTIGYTPDFLVGVWVGNSDNSPMRQVSGQTGAGKIWHDVMAIILNSNYNKETPFSFADLKEFFESGTIEYGLADDQYETARKIILSADQSLIIHPHNGDVFLLENETKIPLVSRAAIGWYINGEFIGNGTSITWQPGRAGNYIIVATSKNDSQQKILVKIVEDN